MAMFMSEVITINRLQVDRRIIYDCTLG